MPNVTFLACLDKIALTDVVCAGHNSASPYHIDVTSVYFKHHLKIRSWMLGNLTSIFRFLTMFTKVVGIINKTVLEQQVSPYFPIIPISVEVTCGSTQVSLCPSPMQIHQSMLIQYPKNFNQKVNDPTWMTLHDLQHHISHMCNSTQWLCPTTIKVHQSICIQWPFFKNL